jgi:DNA-binding NarL/FixJ family response regulator
VLVTALQLVLAGGVYIPPQVLGAPPADSAAFDRPVERKPGPAAIRPQDIGLTDRQSDVLALLVQGKPNKLICRELAMAEGTLKTHISAIFRLLNVNNRTEALFAVSRRGIHLPAIAARVGPAPGAGR